MALELRSYFVCRYGGDQLPSLPWGHALFDCVLVCADPDESQRLAAAFSAEIVRCAVDWVQTTGVHAEFIHDCVDWASVAAGVQDAVGDGHPMTAWHEDAISFHEMCDLAAICFGGADSVLCVVIGSDDDRDKFARLLRHRLAHRE
jgi:hypothetical protein